MPKQNLKGTFWGFCFSVLFRGLGGLFVVFVYLGFFCLFGVRPPPRPENDSSILLKKF